MTIREALHILLFERLAGVAEQRNAMLHGKYERKAMCEPITAENNKQHHQKPPRNVGRIVGEILAGATAGLAIAVPVAYVTEIRLWLSCGACHARHVSSRTVSFGRFDSRSGKDSSMVTLGTSTAYSTNRGDAWLQSDPQVQRNRPITVSR